MKKYTYMKAFFGIIGMILMVALAYCCKTNTDYQHGDETSTSEREPLNVHATCITEVYQFHEEEPHLRLIAKDTFHFYGSKRVFQELEGTDSIIFKGGDIPNQLVITNCEID